MSDLISRKAVDNAICKLMEKLEAEGLSMSYDMDEIIELQMEIEGMPTAYDVDNAVEQLRIEKHTDRSKVYSVQQCDAIEFSMGRAIDIVKGAVKDE